MTLNRVDFPAPFGPMIGADLALRNGEGDVLERPQAPERLYDPFRTSRRTHLRMHPELSDKVPRAFSFTKPTTPPGRRSTSVSRTSPSTSAHFSVHATRYEFRMT